MKIRDIFSLQEKLNINNIGYIVEKYVDDKNIVIRHLDCNYTFRISYGQLSKNLICKVCGHGAQKLSIDDIKNYTEWKTGSEYIIESTEYKTCKDKLIYFHNKCGKHFEMTADRFKAGNRCPHCANVKRSEDKKQGKDVILKRIKEIYNDDIVIDENNVADDITVHDYINVQCKNGHKRKILVRHLLYENNNCPHCSYISQGELCIKEYLTSNSIDFIHHFNGFEDCKSKFGNILEFDFYIPDFNMIIEYDGIFHQKPLTESQESIDKYERIKELDDIKNEYCNRNSIMIIRILENKKFDRKYTISKLDNIFKK